ncbi:signal peptidase I [Nocardioides marmorisolisilvae]|uniref:Signal peptidase I n=1 Tax=Nocardioides marmorisolisilvae TaxID=1542737 RepID=A0A3N0DSA6_9ACTN|nr:signal peptidase I [Nocardioides marmorisolisilvae]RNL78512.1 signal peptidase I [Nocardioides marmorisolisilvae]
MSNHLQITPVRRASGWAINTAVLLVMLAGLAWVAPSLFGYSRYVITGGSMTGTYDIGSVVFEKKTPVEDLKVGDVITYMPPADSGVNHLVTHRVMKMEPAEGGGVLFTTKGDNNPDPDPWHFKLLGQEQPVVQFSVPKAGWVFIALADRTTRMLFIGGPAALIALAALGQLLKELRGSRIWEEKAAAKAPETRRRVLIPPQRTAPAAGGHDELQEAPELV